MAAHTPPHLLTIPREIRNIIYGYLTHDVVHEFLWQECPKSSVRASAIHFEQAPILSVLLTHSQISEEYCESKCFWNLRASVNYTLSHYVSWEGGGNTLARPDQETVKQALSHLHEFAIFVEALPIESPCVWDDAQLLSDILIQHMLQLTTIRLAHYSTLEELPLLTLPELETITMAYAAKHYREAEFDEAVAPPPGSLHKLPLKQQVEGLIFKHMGGKWMPDFPYQVIVVTAWVFTNSKIDRVAMDSGELLQRSPGKALSDFQLEAMSGEEAAQAKRMLSKIHDWKDLRGEEARQGAVDEEHDQLL
jgi:hypothetical protein